MKKYDPVTLEARIDLCESTEELKKEVASIIHFPENKTPDMLFFSGIFVSSGQNLNKAYFLPSELVKSHNTINNKALDIEHSETDIVGHIYSSAFIDRAGNKLDISELQDLSLEELDKMDIDVMIAGILYKSRFPELAKEVKGNKWKLSMETYFQDFDVKIGDLIMSRKEAEALGLASDSVLGKAARILRKGKEIAKGEIARVLRNLLFSGCGLVKNPANPRSVILETAKKNLKVAYDGEEIVIELEPQEGETKIMKDKGTTIEFNSPAADPGGINVNDTRTQTSPGVCVNYKKRVVNSKSDVPGGEIIHENWCALYETGCTSPSRGAEHPECIRRQIIEKTRDYTKHKLADLEARDNRGNLLAKLQNLLGS